MQYILQKFYKEKRAVQEKQAKNDEIVHEYIEEFI